jgi:hypothetical protein
LHFHDPSDLAKCFGNLRRHSLQLMQIVAEELDLAGLRDRRQIPDQVLHELQGLDFQAWHRLLDASAGAAVKTLSTSAKYQFTKNFNAFVIYSYTEDHSNTMRVGFNTGFRGDAARRRRGCTMVRESGWPR